MKQTLGEMQYFKTIENIFGQNQEQDNRTGINTLRLVCNHSVYPTNYGRTYNAMTHKKLAYGGVIGEALAFARGATSAATFRELGCKVWDANANEHGVTPNEWLNNPFREGTDDLGPVYGKQWRRWEDVKLIDVYEPNTAKLDYMLKLGYEIVMKNHNFASTTYVLRREIDQLANVINKIKTKPTDRRMIVSAWNPADLEFIALPACHVLQHYLCTQLTQQERFVALKARLESKHLWYKNHSIDNADAEAAYEDWCEINRYMDLSEDSLDQWSAPCYRLDLVMFQRSCDQILGAPFNIASYDFMINVVARLTNTAPGNLHYLTSDTHIYKNHVDAAHEILEERGIHPENKARLLINPSIKTLKDLERAAQKDFKIVDYVSHPKLRNPTPMAI